MTTLLCITGRTHMKLYANIRNSYRFQVKLLTTIAIYWMYLYFLDIHYELSLLKSQKRQTQMHPLKKTLIPYIYVITAETVDALSQGKLNIGLKKILKSTVEWLKQVCTGTGEGPGDTLGLLHI